jgi:hypothetical protein
MDPASFRQNDDLESRGGILRHAATWGDDQEKGDGPQATMQGNHKNHRENSISISIFTIRNLSMRNPPAKFR